MLKLRHNIAKLPGVSHRRAVRAFKKAGFWVVREGKHISMTDGERIIMGGIIKDAGMTVEEFKRLL